MENEEFINQLKDKGFIDVTISAIFRDEHPRAVLRLTHDHELELCFYDLLGKGKDFIRVFPNTGKKRVISQIDYTLKGSIL